MVDVFAFECRHKDRSEATTYNAPTRGAALAEFYHDVRDCWPDVKWTDLRARKVGGPVASDMFRHVARIRGMPDLRPGDHDLYAAPMSVAPPAPASVALTEVIAAWDWYSRTLNPNDERRFRALVEKYRTAPPPEQSPHARAADQPSEGAKP